MTLQEIYKKKSDEPTPKQRLIADLMKATGKSHDAVLSWCWGRRNPGRGDRDRIAKTLGIDANELFPK